MSTTSIGEASLPVASSAAPEPRRFEPLTKRILERREGETRTHYLAVLVASAAVFPFILIADGIRYAGFRAGAKNAKVAKYFDGKSWSLIDRVSVGSKAAAVRAGQVWTQVKEAAIKKYKELTTKKPVTLSDLNAKSEKAIQNGAVALVKGYDAHNESTSVTAKPEQQIGGAHRVLWAQMVQRVKDNAETSADFVEALDAAKKLVSQAIEEAAGDKFYVVYNNFRGDGLPPLGPQAQHEFAQFANGASRRKELSELALEKNSADADPAAGLAALVQGGIITADEARQVIVSRASSLYAQELASGLAGAEEALSRLLRSAADKGVISEAEADHISRSIRPDVETLAQAAARDLSKNEITDEALLRDQIVGVSDRLVAKSRLSDAQVTEFSTRVADLLSGYKFAREEARKTAEAQAEFQAARAAEIAALPGQLKKSLQTLIDKQAALDEKIKACNELEKQVAGLRGQHFQLKKTKVEIQVDGKVEQVTLRDAHRAYHDALDDASRESLSPQESAARLNALINNNDATRGAIEALDRLGRELNDAVAARLTAYQEARRLFGALEMEIATFDAFYADKQGDLEERKEIEDLRGRVVQKDGVQHKALEEINRAPVFDRLKKRARVRVTGDVGANFKAVFGTQSEEPGSETSSPSAPELVEATA